MSIPAEIEHQIDGISLKLARESKRLSDKDVNELVRMLKEIRFRIAEMTREKN